MTDSSPEAEEPVRFVNDAELIHRFTYHAPGELARSRHEEVRARFRDMALFLNEILPEGRSKSLAFTVLEEASFQAHAAIARGLATQPGEEEDDDDDAG